MNYVKLLIKGKIPIANYFLYSVIVSLVDISIVWTLVRFSEVHLVAANTIGVVSGFVLHYILASKSVFNAKYSTTGFVIYLGTFLCGLVLANWLIYISYEFVFFAYSIDLRILFSKGVSIAVPFFAIYYVRKHAFQFIKRRGW